MTVVKYRQTQKERAGNCAQSRSQEIPYYKHTATVSQFLETSKNLFTSLMSQSENLKYTFSRKMVANPLLHGQHLMFFPLILSRFVLKNLPHYYYYTLLLKLATKDVSFYLTSFPFFKKGYQVQTKKSFKHENHFGKLQSC